MSSKNDRGKNDTIGQKNTLSNLLNRAIKFRKSRYVDHKLEAFKRKFAPVNGVSGVVHATSAYDNAGTAVNNIVDMIDANGFERPSKILFSKDKLNSNWNEIHPIGSGLKDLGHLSSLNAILQVFTYTPALANYMLSRIHGSNCTIQEYCFVCAIEEHIRTALKGSQYALQPRLFVGKLKKMEKGDTKDAFDIWNYFINQTQSFLLSEKGSKDKRVQETTALYQIFGGYLQKRLECQACNNPYNEYESFLDLSLNLTQCSSVEKCLTKYFKESISIPSQCPSCQHEGTFTGKQSIYKSPMVLVLQLQRFNRDGDQTKINKFIQFEETMNIKRTICETEKDHVNKVYHLYAAIVHTGQTIHDGRYIAYVKSSNGIWYCMDNENVQVVSVKKLLEEKPYMLFYNSPVPKTAQHEKKIPMKNETSVPELINKNENHIMKQEEANKAEEATKVEEEVGDEVTVLPSSLDSEDDEEEKRLEQEKLHKAMEEASKKDKIENTAAIVVEHHENMKSKREKLGALIEKESLESKSSEVKNVLLAKTPNNQFQDEISTWDEEVGDAIEKRNQILKQIKPKRKRVDTYDLEYDRGKVKKVKKKQNDKFNKPNMFQIVADIKNTKK
ncbi:uncharacterized protein BX663DRAFT_498314 [Cokeromyces recurvatus]|uniref:uncharacterized protein n=1 Tax=Cokeromyces recurvatus TaxID=90255 RepID=UPI0022211E4E|nr:uncharacterized protein BX663DRAFT_498314 [Cokeromyces recurvatus]KAI7905969.1 hypothetical protein BX663DRAFT_498314 [Cokeromyces recurvatus]